MSDLIDGLRAAWSWLDAALWEIGEGMDAALDRWCP
jgi:hypothetical protein